MTAYVRRPEARRVLPYLLLAVTAAVPVFYALGERGFWGDEVWTVWWSQLFGWRGLIERFNQPPDLPLVIMATKLGTLLGETTLAARLPSAISAVISVLTLFHLARSRLGSWTAFGGALLLAVAPMHVWYTDEEPDASMGWPAHASVSPRTGYFFELGLASDSARELRLEYLAGPGRATTVLVNGTELSTLQLAEASGDIWTSADVPLPDELPAVIEFEIRARGEEWSRVARASLVELGQ